MANLTAPWIRYETSDNPVRRSIEGPVKAAVMIFAGSLVGVVVAANTGGQFVPSPGNNTVRTIGVAACDADNTAAGAADGDVMVSCLRGNFPFHNDPNPTNAVAAWHVGAICYVLDDNTVTMNNTGQVAGKVTEICPNGLIEVEIL